MLAPKKCEIFHESKQRWFILVSCALNCMFACYIGACVTSMGSRLKDRFEINNVQYNFIFTCYALPNIFSPVIGGLIVDYLGVNISLIIFTSFPAFGSFIMVVALMAQNYTLFCFGYFWLALGDLNTRLAGAVLITKWFRPEQQGLVFGMLAAGDSFGSMMDASTTPRLLEVFGFSTAATMAVACTFQLVRFIASFTPLFVEKHLRSRITFPEEPEKPPKTIASSLSVYSKFDRIYWFLVLSIASLYPIALCFGNVAVLFMQTKWHFSLVDAGNLHMTQCIFNLLLAPIIGYGSDKSGRKGHTMVVGGFLYALAYFVLGLFKLTPYFGFLTITVASLLFQTSSFPSIGLLVEEDLKGSAFGFMMGSCSIIATMLPFAVGLILDHFNYGTLMLFFMTLCFVSIGFVVALINEDWETGKRLWTSKARVVADSALESSDEKTPLLPLREKAI